MNKLKRKLLKWTDKQGETDKLSAFFKNEQAKICINQK